MAIQPAPCFAAREGRQTRVDRDQLPWAGYTRVAASIQPLQIKGGRCSQHQPYPVVAEPMSPFVDLVFFVIRICLESKGNLPGALFLCLSLSLGARVYKFSSRLSCLPYHLSQRREKGQRGRDEQERGSNLEEITIENILFLFKMDHEPIAQWWVGNE